MIMNSLALITRPLLDGGEPQLRRCALRPRKEVSHIVDPKRILIFEANTTDVIPAHSDPPDSSQAFCGKPRFSPPWLGSNQREVITLPRVKKCRPSTPWAWVSPNSEFFQPPKE